MEKNPYSPYLFIAQAPGSTEVYAIPNRWKEDFLKWCDCELFDQKWKYCQELFKPYQIKMTDEEYRRRTQE